MGEDLTFELLQLRAGIDAQLRRQLLTPTLVGVERLVLPPAAIERDHQLGAQVLTQRVGGDEVDELGDELAVPPRLEVRIDALLQCADA